MRRRDQRAGRYRSLPVYISMQHIPSEWLRFRRATSPPFWRLYYRKPCCRADAGFFDFSTGKIRRAIFESAVLAEVLEIGAVILRDDRNDSDPHHHGAPYGIHIIIGRRLYTRAVRWKNAELVEEGETPAGNQY